MDKPSSELLTKSIVSFPNNHLLFLNLYTKFAASKAAFVLLEMI